MSLLLLRAALLAQGRGETAPPAGTDLPWALDATRRPAGYSLSDGDQTALNTTGGSDYRRWVPTAKPILPSDGRRYWEVLCTPGGAASFDGYMGIVSEAQRPEYDAGLNPITLGSIGWRGNGTLWSSTTSIATQQVSGLPPHGAGDVLMFVLDPATAELWLGRNGIWHTDPTSSPATWTTAPSTAFYPQIQGRSAGDGGSLRSLPAQFSYPVPPGVLALGALLPDLRIFEAQAFLEIGWDGVLSVSYAETWLDLGGGLAPGVGAAAAFLDLGGADRPTTASASLFLELEIP
jgi:hypothetical protein